MAGVPIPTNLQTRCRADGRGAWLQHLPAEIDDIAERWSLRVEDPFEPGGQTAWAAPAASPVHGDAVLKVAWRHMESEDEAAGLRAWDGQGAVRVFADARLNETTTALLLERCRPGTTLDTRPEEEQDEVVSALLQRLWRTPDRAQVGAFRSLQTMCDYWADCFERRLAEGTVRVDPDLAAAGVSLFRSLPAGAAEQVLLCTDLHAENILSAQREEWLVIDPKPFVGDPTYDALQHLLNSAPRLVADPLALIARVAGLLDLDPERLRTWLFARCVVDSDSWPWMLDVARDIRP